MGATDCSGHIAGPVSAWRLAIIPTVCADLTTVDVLVAYDIGDTEGAGAARLRTIAGVCEKYGQRVQLSVFECRLSPTRLARMVGEILDAIDETQDSVIVYRFAGEIGDSKMEFGRYSGRRLGDPWVV